MTARVADRNGWFEIPANPISRVGVFQYRGSSIKGSFGLDDTPDPAKMYGVFRPPSTLSDPDTINSFRLLPWIVDHTMLGDPEDVGPGYIPAEQKGVHGVTGENVWFDPQTGILYSNIKAFSSRLADTIDAGKIDLSLGYRCKYVAQKGVYQGQPYDYVQVAMLGNHMATVDDARCDVRVMDSLSVCFDAKDVVVMPESLKKRNPKAFAAIVKTAVGAYATKAQAPKFKAESFACDAAEKDAMASDDGDMNLADISEMLADIMPQIADINGSMNVGAGLADPGMDEMEPEMDEKGQPVMDEKGQPKMKKKMPAALAAAATDSGKKPDEKKDDEKDGKAMDAIAMDAAIEKAVQPLKAKIAELETSGVKRGISEVAKRNTLAAKLSAFVGTFDHSEMTLADVAKYGVEKLGVPAMDGQEEAAVNAYLHGRTAPKPAFTVAGGTGMDGEAKGAEGSVNGFLKSLDEKAA